MFFKHPSQAFHTGIPPMGQLWLGGCLLFLSLTGQAQEMRLTIIEQRAQADATYEQRVQWQTPEDELDYWTDQRNFEEVLEKRFFQGYQTYIRTKQAVYRDHRAFCAAACGHGDYYELQAAFYAQFPATGNLASHTTAFENPQ